jgi:hypothetical protein
MHICIYSILCIFSIYSIFYILFEFSNLNSDVKPGYKISDNEDQNITPSQPQYHKPDSPHHPVDYPAHLMAPPPPSQPTFDFHSFMHRSGVKLTSLFCTGIGFPCTYTICIYMHVLHIDLLSSCILCLLFILCISTYFLTYFGHHCITAKYTKY